MDLYLNNLAAAATAEKNVLDKLVKNNEKLIDQLAKLTAKFESLSSPNNSQTGDKPKYRGKNLLFVQYKKDGYCHTHGYKCTKGHNSETCTRPGPSHNRMATRQNTKGGSTAQKNWVCSQHEEKGYWVT